MAGRAQPAIAEQGGAVATPARELGERCCATALPAILSEEQASGLRRDLEILAHPIRLRLLSVLAGRSEPTCVCDFESVVPVKQPTISHHLKLLRAAGLIDVERRGLWAYYQVNREALSALCGRIGASLALFGEDACQ